MFGLVTFVIFALVSTALWCALVPLYGVLFDWTEFFPGINWIYLPHGLRMILVLLFGVPGALGITLGSDILGRTLMRPETEVSMALDLSLAGIPGIAAWLAVWLIVKEWPGRSLIPRISGNWAKIEGSRLILLALVSAVLNSGGHSLVWYLFDEPGPEIASRYLVMFIGDFLGALVLLYGLKFVIIAIERVSSR